MNFWTGILTGICLMLVVSLVSLAFLFHGKWWGP